MGRAACVPPGLSSATRAGPHRCSSEAGLLATSGLQATSPAPSDGRGQKVGAPRPPWGTFPLPAPAPRASESADSGFAAAPLSTRVLAGGTSSRTEGRPARTWGLQQRQPSPPGPRSLPGTSLLPHSWALNYSHRGQVQIIIFFPDGIDLNLYITCNFFLICFFSYFISSLTVFFFLALDILIVKK